MRFSDQLKSEIDKKMLEAINSLKRATGISDQRDKRDRLDEQGKLHIYTTDGDSLAVLSALVHQFVHGNNPVWELDSRGQEAPLPQNYAFMHRDTDCELTAFVPNSDRVLFIERIDDYIEKLIAPTGPETTNTGVVTEHATRKASKPQRSR